jgi:hypothetical protein
VGERAGPAQHCDGRRMLELLSAGALQ